MPLLFFAFRWKKIRRLITIRFLISTKWKILLLLSSIACHFFTRLYIARCRLSAFLFYGVDTWITAILIAKYSHCEQKSGLKIGNAGIEISAIEHHYVRPTHLCNPRGHLTTLQVAVCGRNVFVTLAALKFLDVRFPISTSVTDLIEGQKLNVFLSIYLLYLQYVSYMILYIFTEWSLTHYSYVPRHRNSCSNKQQPVIARPREL